MALPNDLSMRIWCRSEHCALLSATLLLATTTRTAQLLTWLLLYPTLLRAASVLFSTKPCVSARCCVSDRKEKGGLRNGLLMRTLRVRLSFQVAEAQGPRAFWWLLEERKPVPMADLIPGSHLVKAPARPVQCMPVLVPKSGFHAPKHTKKCMRNYLWLLGLTSFHLM